MSSTLLNKKIEYWENPNYTECVSDIASHFKGLTSQEVNEVLLDSGVIEKTSKWVFSE